jgi:triacylglycerol lipase
MPTIILHHGLLGGGMSVGRIKWKSFRNIDTHLAAEGHSVFVSAVHPTASIERRASQLQKWMRSLLPGLNGQPIILVAHSMGGLDARFMLTHLEMARHVSALVTICAPHRGSSLADWILEHVGRRLRGLDFARQFGLEIGALPDLTREQCARFNEKTPDAPGVKYYSVAAARPLREMPAFARPSHLIVSKTEGPNDGLVSVRSAQWGKYLATWRADHWQTVNRQYSWRKIHRPMNIAENYLQAIECALRDLQRR